MKQQEQKEEEVRRTKRRRNTVWGPKLPGGASINNKDLDERTFIAAQTRLHRPDPELVFAHSDSPLPHTPSI